VSPVKSFTPPFHQVLVHLGLLTKESGFKIAENAFSGGPLGELVQWSDLITTLYLLGHDVRISASLAELKESVRTQRRHVLSAFFLLPASPGLVF